ncbi:MAG: flagellar brake protein [Proteobacteria bacterium]|nr:flagellar brake protein [Pseudomonadota bacterium]
MTETTSDFDMIKETLSKLGIGTSLSIGFSDVSANITSVLVGMEFGEYIIITPPEPLSSIRTKLFQGNKIVIRFLYKGQVIAFPSEIIDYITGPKNLVFVSYPRKMIQQNIRSAKRIECLIPAITFINAREVKMVITDISPKGCGLVINLADDHDLPEIKINSEIKIKSEYLLGSNELDLKGIVKNARKKQGKLFVGLQFSELHQQVRKNIDSYNLFLENFVQ